MTGAVTQPRQKFYERHGEQLPLPVDRQAQGNKVPLEIDRAQYKGGYGNTSKRKLWHSAATVLAGQPPHH
jgi:hypothetical protein